jgi:hypothetical protein
MAGHFYNWYRRDGALHRDKALPCLYNCRVFKVITYSFTIFLIAVLPFLS